LNAQVTQPTSGSYDSQPTAFGDISHNYRTVDSDARTSQGCSTPEADFVGDVATGFSVGDDVLSKTTLSRDTDQTTRIGAVLVPIVLAFAISTFVTEA
jgi:hypothetical protein